MFADSKNWEFIFGPNFSITVPGSILCNITKSRKVSSSTISFFYLTFKKLLMKFSFLGGAGEVGRSAYLIEDEKRLLLDYGIKLHQRTEYPLPFQGFVDYSILSHAHLDHSGFIPGIYEYCSPPCIATYPTQALSTL